MVDMVTGLFGTIMYPLFSIIFLILDIMQWIFNSLAGIGSLMVTTAGTKFDDNKVGGNFGDSWLPGAVTNDNTGDVKGTGLIFYMLNTPLVKNLLMSISILALFLLILFTVIAFIKNAYTVKPKKWQDIVGNALKGLISFVAIPVFCLLGVWVSNIVLQAINGATSTGGSTRLSNKLFICCAYNANSYRLGTYGDNPAAAEKCVSMSGLDIEIPEGATKDQLANIVDTAFGSAVGLGGEGYASLIYTRNTVAIGYSLGNINYLLLVVAGVFMLSVMTTLTYAMIRRIFILTMLFVISPAICAMYPLDDGSAVGSWRKNFIATTIGAYSSVAGMNLFFSLLPLIESITFLPSSLIATNDVDYIIQMLMIICGLFVVKEVISMISGYIGGDDAYAKGGALRSSSKTAMAKYGGAAAGGVIGAFASGIGSKQKGGSFFSGAMESVKDSVLGKADDAGVRKGGLFGTMFGGTQERINSALASYKAGGKLAKIDEELKNAGTKYNEADTKYNTLVGEYTALENEYKSETDPKKRKSLQGKMGAKAKQRNSAEKSRNAIAESIQGMNVRAEKLKKLEKQYGLAEGTFTASEGRVVELSGLHEKYQTAAIESNAMVEALDLATKRNPDKSLNDDNARAGLRTIFGAKDDAELMEKIEPVLTGLGKTIHELAQMLKEGVKFTAEDLNGKSIETQAAASTFNKKVDDIETKKDKAKDAGNALIDFLRENQDAFYKADGSTVKIDNLDNLVEAIQRGDVSDADYVKMMKDITDGNKTIADAIKSIVADDKELKNFLKELKKK